MAYSSYRLRRLHRFLGVSVGIQLLMWTISGLYFSWVDLDVVHGDPQKKAPAPLLAHSSDSLCSPSLVLLSLQRDMGTVEVKDLRLINILQKNYWQVTFVSDADAEKQHRLADAKTGAFRPALSEAEAIELAKNAFNGEGTVVKTEYLTQMGAHHEFRENPLPAYAVYFEHPTNTTIYVSAELGTVQKYRNTAWRIFDFLWMFHTMDYRSRDDINNWVLRIFSILGLLTVGSGFVLFGLTVRRKPAVV